MIGASRDPNDDRRPRCSESADEVVDSRIMIHGASEEGHTRSRRMEIVSGRPGCHEFGQPPNPKGPSRHRIAIDDERSSRGSCQADRRHDVEYRIG